MEIVALVARVLIVVLASLISVVYVASQLWQRVPAPTFQIKATDTVIYLVTALLFAFGTDSYYGLLAFLPLLAWKFFCHLGIQKNRVRGSGRWMEVQWQRMTPRGFQLPAEVMQNLSRLPGDAHIVVPRFASLLAVKLFLSSVKKNSKKMPVPMKGAQVDQSMQMVENLAGNIARLDSGKTEQMNLPFGVLKVTRL